MTIVSAKVYFQKSEVGGKTKIGIEVNSLEEFLENKIIKVPIPTAGKTNQNSKSPQTKYKDLKKINHIISIKGFIYAQQSTNAAGPFYDAEITVKGDTTVSLTATEAKNAFIYYILYPFGDITLFWRGISQDSATPASPLADLTNATDTLRSATVVFEKIQFADVPAQIKEFSYSGVVGYTNTETSPKRYAFNATLVKGVTF